MIQEPSAEIPNVWALLFEHTPTALRVLLGVLSVGIFTVLGVLYRWHREDMTRVKHRVDLVEQRLDTRLNEVNQHLIEIAINTRKSNHGEESH